MNTKATAKTPVTSAVAQHFSAKEAAEFAGLSLAMVDYLCRYKLVIPANERKRGRGVQRWYSFGDIVVLRSVAKLLEAGVSVLRLKKALANLRAQHSDITFDGMPATYLVTDGKDVFFRHKTGVLELLTNGQLSFAFVVEVESVRKEAVEFANLVQMKAATNMANRSLTQRKTAA